MSIGWPSIGAAGPATLAFPKNVLPLLAPDVSKAARRLDRIARKFQRADAQFDQSDHASLEWDNLYSGMVDGAHKLREALGTSIPHEQQLRAWTERISPSDEARALWPLEEMSGLSPQHLERWLPLKAALEEEARLGLAFVWMENGYPTKEQWQRLNRDAGYRAHAAASDEARRLVYRVRALFPRTAGDRRLHRLTLDHIWCANPWALQRRYRSRIVYPHGAFEV